MAKTMPNLTTILFLLLIVSLALLHHSQMVSSTDDAEDDDAENEDEEYYVPDTPLRHFGPTRSRFLASVIKKGTHCDRVKNNVCNGIPAKKGTGLLFCCKKHCRNVLGDKNNCGQCGHKCEQGRRCCAGICTKVLSNAHHCGKCNKKCSPGVPCENGFCGYA